MSNPVRVGRPAGNQDDDNNIIVQAYNLAYFSPLTSSPAGVRSASNQPISDLFDDEAEEAARQRRRTQAARGKRPAARGRQSLTGTATTTTQRLPTQRPRRSVNPLTPSPRGASSPNRGRGRPPSISPGRSFTSFSPGSPSSVQAAAAAANEGDLQQVFQILASDVNNRVQNRRISGITTTNTITTVYKNGRPPSVRRNSTRISN